MILGCQIMANFVAKTQMFFASGIVKIIQKNVRSVFWLLGEKAAIWRQGRRAEPCRGLAVQVTVGDPRQVRTAKDGSG